MPSASFSQKNSSFYFFNIVYLTFLKSFLNLIDSKELAKENITKTLTLFNSFCFWLSIFPFLCFTGKFYFSGQMNIISSNLPGLNKNANEVWWETLLCPLDYTEKLLNNLNSIDVNSNSLILSYKKINPSVQTLLDFEIENQKSFKEFKPRELNQFPRTASTDARKTNLFNFYDLDEIPLKLESTQKGFEEKTISVLNSNEKPKNNQKSFNKTKNLKSLIKDKKTLKIIKTKALSQNPKNESPKSVTIKNWSNFSLANDSLSKYFRSEFLKETLEFSFYSNAKTESQVLVPRAMTWYKHPDMTTHQVWSLVSVDLASAKSSQTTSQEKKGDLSSRTNELTTSVCYYPKSIYFNSVSNIPTKASILPPTFEINQFLTDTGTEQKQSLLEINSAYIKHNPKTSDLLIQNNKEFQKSFFDTVIQNNYETNKSRYFFANLSKENFEQLLKASSFNLEEKEKQVNNLTYPIIPTTSFFTLPDPNLSELEIKKYYDPRFSDILGPEVSNKLIQISDLRNGEISYIQPNFSNKNSKNIEKQFNGLNNVSLNFSNQIIQFNNSFLEYSPNIYKREIGSYWKNKLKFSEKDEFLTLNEPITVNSIYSVSLFGFLISTFLILRSAYADYAKEFSSYLLDLISSGKGLPLDPSTIEWLNQELGIEEKKGGIRVFPKRFSNKRFTDIAGIKVLLPELSELVWFLRNKGRRFSVTRLANKSVLLVGPPGTGKTLLVQALAAEAEVPVVAQSTSVLSGMSQDLTPGDAIRMAFQKARALAPCILFLDELDSLGLKRDSLLLNQADQAFGSSENQNQNSRNKFFEKSQNSETDVSDANDSWVDNKTDYLTNQLRINITNDFNQQKQQERDQVAALTQLLIEIDGLQANNGVLVIGATNRPNVLDPALTRPGRFSKIISLPLPDKPKRVEILKLYSKNLGWNSEINWDYLAQRTKGFSAGDLSAIANQSSIQAILKESKHNLQTFENAITVLTTYPREKTKQLLTNHDPYFSLRELYYKVSQTVYNYIFDVEGKNPFIELVSRDPNPRQFQIISNLNQDKNRLRVRHDLENILTSLLAGKAGEILMLLTNKNKQVFYWESDFCKKDLYEATRLIITMIQDWYLYTSPLYQQKFVNIPINQNELEYRKNEEVFELLIETSKYLEQQLTTQYKMPNSESLSQKASWKTDVLQEISSLDGLFSEWSRFHLPDPQETDRNQEWIPPEEYYHENDTKRINDSKTQETYKVRYLELLLIERERYAQKILINSFNKAFLFLELNRELIDTLSCFLVKRKILREFEIESLINVD